MTVGAEIADMLVQRADVLRATIVTSGTGVTRRDYAAFASAVPCRIYVWRSRASAGGRSSQFEAGLRVESDTTGLFLLDAPILTQDRIVVDGATYLVTFKRLVHDDEGPSHLSVELERVAVAPMLEAGAV